MDAEQLLTWLVTILLGAGFLGAILTIFTGRQTARKIGLEAKALEAKTPGEVESIAIAGAEKAVLMLQMTNETLASQNDRLLRENASLRQIVETLEAKVETYRRSMELVEASLAAARREYEELHATFERFRATVAATSSMGRATDITRPSL